MTDPLGPAAHPPFGDTLARLLLDRAACTPDRVLLIWEDSAITTAEIAQAALALATLVRGHGIDAGDTVLTMVEPGPSGIALYLGLALAGAVWVPQAPDARGPSLAHVLAVARPDLVLAHPEAMPHLAAADPTGTARVLPFEGRAWPLAPASMDPASMDPIAPEPGGPDSLHAILFTSGTTGPPKGVRVTDRMLMASAAGCAEASLCDPEDVFLMWEPMHHIGGPQLLAMALVHGPRLVVVPRFSASRFWPLVRQHGVTKLHYLGGILDILLKAPPRPDDARHPIRLAFGGGARPETRRAIRTRFRIPIREVFGMTEASSFTSVDARGTDASIGQVLPWMKAALVDADGAPVAPGAVGEIAVKPRFPGLLTQGYLSDPEATARLLRDGWLYTGDMGRRDAEGNLYFLGRKTDSLRRRGENISAWEVETALARHPDIAETAVVGVPAAIGESDILCFVLMRDGIALDAADLAAWCQQNLPRSHVPRYWKQVEGFDRTPSQRILKTRLDRDPGSAIDIGDPR